MKLVFATRSKKSRKTILAFPKRRGIEVEALTVESANYEPPKPQPDSILYEDFTGLDAKERSKLLKALEKRGGAWGVIELDGASNDPALFFFSGACDYIGPGIQAESITSDRFKKALTFNFCEGSVAEVTAEKKTGMAFPGWDNLVEGVEYDFWIVFAQPSGLDGIKKKIGETRFEALKKAFFDMMARHSSPWNAKTWLSQEHQVIILFPKGNGAKSPLDFCFRELLNRALSSYEELGLEIPVTWKFALHSGSIPWREQGNTGTLVAESLNFVFHLGHKFAPDGTVSVSQAAADLINRDLSPFFIPAGEFEGETIMIMRKFLD